MGVEARAPSDAAGHRGVQPATLRRCAARVQPELPLSRSATSPSEQLQTLLLEATHGRGFQCRAESGSALAPSDPGWVRAPGGRAKGRLRQPGSRPRAAHPAQAGLAEPGAEEQPGRSTAVLQDPRGVDGRDHAPRGGAAAWKLAPSGSLQAPDLKGPRAQLSPKGNFCRPGPRMSQGGTPPPAPRPHSQCRDPKEPTRISPRPGLPLLALSPQLPNSLEDPAACPASPGPSRLPSGLFL